jgi:hypothetical protein
VLSFGAFELRTEQALPYCVDGRTSAHFIALPDQIVITWTEGEIILILDHLFTQKPFDVLLLTLAHPPCAPWLNLIESWWKSCPR